MLHKQIGEILILILGCVEAAGRAADQMTLSKRGADQSLKWVGGAGKEGGGGEGLT